MDNINKAQINSKTFLRIITMLSVFALVLSITVSNVYAVPNRSNDNATCTPTGEKSKNGLEIVRCCWFERVPDGTGNPILGSPPGSSEEYCSECENGGSRGNINCSDPELQFRVAPTTDESVFPIDQDNVLEEEQSQPDSPLTNQRVPPGNVGVLEQLEDSSNNEQSQESEESTETNNVKTKSNSQENDGRSNSETTNSLAKRGNTQNSPVPPECPKQGPIPPDCTMKPKF